jgi:hypothetical protein
MNPVELKALAEMYKTQHEDGEITDTEFKELIKDLDISKTIAKNADAFEKDQETRDYLIKILDIALAIYP